MNIQNLSLEGDGISDNLFHLLWCDSATSTSENLGISVPDTIIFRYMQPTHWYFSSVSGSIKKKSKAKLTNNHIIEHFSKKLSKCKIAAHYGYTVENDGVIETTLDHYVPDDLSSMLFRTHSAQSISEQGSTCGVLQRWINPKGDHNTLIKASWSPQVCLLERRINRKRLDDHRVPLFERVATFEGPVYLADSAPLCGAWLPDAIATAGRKIADHVASVTSDRLKICRMTIIFKIDKHNRLWLLFASSVRCAKPEHPNSHAVHPIKSSGHSSNNKPTSDPLSIQLLQNSPIKNRSNNNHGENTVNAKNSPEKGESILSSDRNRQLDAPQPTSPHSSNPNLNSLAPPKTPSLSAPRRASLGVTPLEFQFEFVPPPAIRLAMKGMGGIDHKRSINDPYGEKLMNRQSTDAIWKPPESQSWNSTLLEITDNHSNKKDKNANYSSDHKLNSNSTNKKINSKSLSSIHQSSAGMGGLGDTGFRLQPSEAATCPLCSAVVPAKCVYPVAYRTILSFDAARQLRMKHAAQRLQRESNFNNERDNGNNKKLTSKSSPHHAGQSPSSELPAQNGGRPASLSAILGSEIPRAITLNTSSNNMNRLGFGDGSSKLDGASTSDFSKNAEAKRTRITVDSLAHSGNTNGLNPDGNTMEIPDVIKKLHPRLHPSDFAKYRYDPMFLFRVVSLCEACCLEMTTATLDLAAGSIPIASKIKGTQSLRSNSLKKRRNSTLTRIKEHKEAEKELDKLLSEKARDEIFQRVFASHNNIGRKGQNSNSSAAADKRAVSTAPSGFRRDLIFAPNGAVFSISNTKSGIADDPSNRAHTADGNTSKGLYRFEEENERNWLIKKPISPRVHNPLEDYRTRLRTNIQSGPRAMSDLLCNGKKVTPLSFSQLRDRLGIDYWSLNGLPTASNNITKQLDSLIIPHQQSAIYLNIPDKTRPKSCPSNIGGRFSHYDGDYDEDDDVTDTYDQECSSNRQKNKSQNDDAKSVSNPTSPFNASLSRRSVSAFHIRDTLHGQLLHDVHNGLVTTMNLLPSSFSPTRGLSSSSIGSPSSFRFNKFLNQSNNNNNLNYSAITGSNYGSTKPDINGDDHSNRDEGTLNMDADRIDTIIDDEADADAADAELQRVFTLFAPGAPGAELMKQWDKNLFLSNALTMVSTKEKAQRLGRSDPKLAAHILKQHRLESKIGRSLSATEVKQLTDRIYEDGRRPLTTEVVELKRIREKKDLPEDRFQIVADKAHAEANLAQHALLALKPLHAISTSSNDSVGLDWKEVEEAAKAVRDRERIGLPRLKPDFNLSPLRFEESVEFKDEKLYLADMVNEAITSSFGEKQKNKFKQQTSLKPVTSLDYISKNNTLMSSHQSDRSISNDIKTSSRQFYSQNINIIDGNNRSSSQRKILRNASKLQPHNVTPPHSPRETRRSSLGVASFGDSLISKDKNFQFPQSVENNKTSQAPGHKFNEDDFRRNGSKSDFPLSQEPKGFSNPLGYPPHTLSRVPWTSFSTKAAPYLKQLAHINQKTNGFNVLKTGQYVLPSIEGKVRVKTAKSKVRQVYSPSKEYNFKQQIVSDDALQYVN